MSFWSRLRAFLLGIPRWVLLLGGTWALVRSALAACGGYEKLWLFQKMEQHRYTAMAMLTGTLRLRNGLSRAGHDEEVYNGATYTNWGFGVPILQMPFHAAAFRMRRFAEGFFPDRVIYLVYLALMIVILWAGFDRLIAMRQPGGVVGAARLRRHLLSWSATAFVLVTTLYPLMSCRFIIYEETLCYLMICDFAALAAYIFALRSWGTLPLIGMGVASGMGLLVRPTGLIFMGVLGAIVVLESRRKKPVAVFAASILPFVAFWLFTNWVRTGTPVGLGFANSLPFSWYHTPMVRFGSLCTDTREHLWQATTRLFKALFVVIPDDAAVDNPAPWMKTCHFDFELRPPPAGDTYTREPLFGVAVPVVLTWILLHYLARRERRLSVYVPFAAMVFLFANYVHAGAGLAWRYVGDFWPLILLVCVQYVAWLPVAAVRYLGLRLALLFMACGAAGYLRFIKPSVTTVETRDPATVTTAQWDDFTNSRYSMDPPVASRISCGDRLALIYKNGEGWDPGCAVNTFTNVFLGVPYKTTDDYAVRFHVEGDAPQTLRVYVNGRIYTVHKDHDTYLVPVRIRYTALTSPTVMATIEWTREAEAPQGVKLKSIEII